MAIEEVSAELIARCQRNDPGSHDQLFTLIQQDLYRWIISIVRNPDDADEIFQECCIRMLRHLPRLKEPAKFPAWLSRMVVNQSCTYRSRAGKRQTLPLEETYDIPNESLVAQSSAPEDARKAIYRKEVFAEVNSALAQLPPRQKAAVMLFDVENRSIKEIAAIMECSEGAVKFNIHEGRQKLRQLLGHHLDASSDRIVIE